MRVAMVNRADAFSVPGGDTTQTVQLKRSLEERGVHISLFTVEHLPDKYDFDIIHVFNRWTLQQVPHLLSTAWKHLPVVITTNFWHMFEPWFDTAVRKQRKWRAAARMLGRPLARKLYASWQRARWKRSREITLLSQAMQRCDVVITNSRAEITYLERLFDLQARVVVVPVGIDAEAYAQRPRPSEMFYQKHRVDGFILQVGRIQSHKNQLALIEALFDLPVPLVFVGQPSPYEDHYVRACRQRAEERGNVVFAGYWPAEDLPGVYALANMHVLPSWAELPGLASLEAGVSGCEVVSTISGCAREYLEDWAAYCDPGSLRSIRQAVASALDAPAPPKLRESILQNYTWDHAAERLLKVYEDLLGSA